MHNQTTALIEPRLTERVSEGAALLPAVPSRKVPLGGGLQADRQVCELHSLNFLSLQAL